MQVVVDTGIYFGMSVIGAIAIWIVGRWLIGFATRVAASALERQKIDPTLSRYLGTMISVTLTIILVVAILGFFGVETTSFAAIVAAAGVAIGMAWSGLLANFAAGAFLTVLRPFKVGDFVTATGVTGTVQEIDWQVYFDTNKAIREAFGAAGFPAAEQQIVVRNRP